MTLGWSQRTAIVAMATALMATGCNREGVFFQSMNPASGRITGGEEVRIRGSGFKGLSNLEIRIGGRPATNIGVADDQTIVLTTPDAREGDVGHAIDVYLLTNEGRSYVLRGAFTYRRGANDTTSPNSDLQRRL